MEKFIAQTAQVLSKTIYSVVLTAKVFQILKANDVQRGATIDKETALSTMGVSEVNTR